jgi:predicted nucleic acid-binding protein
MKAYLDSGIFIDYLIGRGHAGPYLRSTSRRGRLPAQLGLDAEVCLTRLATQHQALTSSLTAYEVEEAMYRELRNSTSGVPHASKYIIPASRAVMTQTLMTIDKFKIELVDLTKEIILAQCSDIVLQMKGVRAADALHVTTALLHDADLLLSTDSAILDLDDELKTITGKTMKCLDTDAAIGIL